MGERPIIFGAESVRAILAGTKTQTRRPIEPRPDGRPVFFEPHQDWFVDGGRWCRPCRYGVPGDRLWVREVWTEMAPEHQPPRCGYRADTTADGEDIRREYIRSGYPYRWRSPIHMPRWASRITLELTNVRVQRVQEITHAEAAAEGVRCWICGGPIDGTSEADCACFHTHTIGRDSFAAAWDDMHDPKREGRPNSWESNPFVWCLSFRRL